MTEVSLEVQAWILEFTHVYMMQRLQHVMQEYENRIYEMAFDRLHEGYTHYGSEMYGWSEEKRLQNVMEEVADAIVYLTSGPLPECPCGTIGLVEELRRDHEEV